MPALSLKSLAQVCEAPDDTRRGRKRKSQAGEKGTGKIDNQKRFRASSISGPGLGGQEDCARRPSYVHYARRTRALLHLREVGQAQGGLSIRRPVERIDKLGSSWAGEWERGGGHRAWCDGGELEEEGGGVTGRGFR